MQATMSAIALPLVERKRRYVEARQQKLLLQCARSLPAFLDAVVIDSHPEPRRWGEIVEPWQVRLCQKLVPAIEHACGVRPDYTGPRNFYLVMPRGHDKTGLIGRLCNWAVGFSSRRISAVAAASTSEQATLLLESMTAERRLTPWLAGRIESQRSKMLGPGGVLKVISADAPHSSGLKCDLIICDELTFWENRTLFDVLYSGREKRPSAVFIIITNAGLRLHEGKPTWQYELLQTAMKSPDWFVYQSPIGMQLASWMTPERVALIRSIIPISHAKRVIDNQWIDATETPLLPFSLMQTCFDPDCLWPVDASGAGIMPKGSRPQLYIGGDIGYAHDPACIYTLELLNHVATTREVFVMDPKKTGTISPEELEHELIKRIGSPYCLQARVDEGAVGYVIARKLEKLFPHKVEGVTLGKPKQGQLALGMKTAFDNRKISIPNEADLISDFSLIDQVETGTGGLPNLKTNRGETGHGDRFWAAALALYGVPFEAPRYSAMPMGRKSKNAF
jgi:hypothetical protein